MAFKTMLALAAAALPALAVAAVLVWTLITAVGKAEADFDKATSEARRYRAGVSAAATAAATVEKLRLSSCACCVRQRPSSIQLVTLD